MSDLELFILDNPEAAFAESKAKNKLLFIDFSAIWCPPCNELEETVFSKPAFKKFGKDFVFLRLDVDKETSWDLKNKYQIKGYPTLVILQPPVGKSREWLVPGLLGL